MIDNPPLLGILRLWQFLPKVFTSLLVKQKITSMSPATMNISLPDSLKEYVKERVEEEHYSTPSDYVRSLIREDQKQRDEKKLEQMLLEGVRSGRGMEIGSKEWKEFWEEIHARIQEKTKTRT
jgi:antitoxin ParD1/3/4